MGRRECLNLCLACIFLGGSMKFLLCGNKLHMVGENAYNVAKSVDCDTHLQFCSQIHSLPLLSALQELPFCKQHFQGYFCQLPSSQVR